MAQAKSKNNKPNINFSLNEILLTHFDSIDENAKDAARQFFKANFQQSGKYSEFPIDEGISKYLTDLKDSIPYPGPDAGQEEFTFIDLFAGIGGFRMALQNLGGRCVFSSEWDKYSKLTYKENYGEIPFGDITSAETRHYIPNDFDLLCGGFPCQPFSLAGVSKKNSLGILHGFDDARQGNLFFHIADILEAHRPKAFFLENVKNLISHDKGRTFNTIQGILYELRYSFDHRVLDGKHFVPQHRERTIMVGFNKEVFGEEISFDFNSVALPDATHRVRDILQNRVPARYTLSEHLWNYLQEYARKHKAKGNGFGFGLVDRNSITRTMSARYHKDGSEILIPPANGEGIPRRLTPKEAAALLGYPANFKIPVSDTQAYRQFGNSVVMPLIQAVGVQILNVLNTV